MKAEDLRARILGPSLPRLVDNAVDYFLDQPIAKLIDKSFVQNQIVLALQTMSQGEQAEQWAKEMLDQLRSMAPEETPKIDRELLEPIEELLSFPFALDEQICLELMQHEAIEDLLRAVLTDTLEEFGTKLRSISESATPKNISKGFGAFRSLRDKALKSTPLGDITQLLEKQIQYKTKEHVTKSIDASIIKTAKMLADPQNREKQGAFRVHVLSTILSSPVSLVLEQIDALGTERFVLLLSQFFAQLSQNESFQKSLSTTLEQSMELWGDKTMRSILDESGMGESWRDDTQPMITEMAREFVQTKGFLQWLTQVLQEEVPQEEGAS